MKKDDLEQIKNIIDAGFETHLAAVHEEITDLGAELKAEIGALRREVHDGLEAVTSKLGGLANRIDNETFARKDLEHRLRRVLSDLPEAAHS